jgi:effector-binding domain-containing protein
MFTEPKISLRDEQPSVGIRAKTPFKGMFAVVDTLLKELRTWVKAHGIADQGPFFLRYHVETITKRGLNTLLTTDAPPV